MNYKFTKYQQKLIKWLEEHKGESFVLLKNRSGGLSIIQKIMKEKEEKISGKIDNTSAITVSGNGKGNTSATYLSKEEAETKVWKQL